MNNYDDLTAEEKLFQIEEHNKRRNKKGGLTRWNKLVKEGKAEAFIEKMNEAKRRKRKKHNP